MAIANERPIIVKKVKKVAGGHHGGAWKVAYADFVTAMMAFFMLLWLISVPDKKKLEGLAEYFSPASPSTLQQDAAGGVSGMSGYSRDANADTRDANGVPTMEAATRGAARGGEANIPDASQRVIAAELRVVIDTLPQPDGKPNMAVEPARDGLRITLMDSDRQSMFRSGTAELNGFARSLLARVAQSLGASGAPIAIEGHTDGTGGASSDANWRLSGDRAIAARSALLAAGLSTDRVAEVVAMAGTQPVYPDQPDRPENRRITIVLKGEESALPADASFAF